MTRVNTQSRFIEMFGRIDSKKRLGDVASYINGFAFKPSDWTTSGLPIIRIQNLTGSNELFNYYNGDYPAQVEVNNGDILISWSATLGVFVWAQGKALLNQHIFKVSFDKGYVNRDYFIYAVTQKLDEMATKTHGTTMRHIVKSDFDNTVIPFPDKTEQDCFATFANQADKSKFNGFKSRFIEMFEGDKFKKVRLGDYTDLTWGDTNTTKNSYVPEGYLAFSAGGPDGKLDHYDYDQEGIVLSAIGADCGKTWFTTGKWSCIKNTIRFWSTSEELDNYFLFLATRDKEYWPRRGGAQPFIPQTDARNCVIPLPSLALQRQFISFANQADKSK